MVDEPATIWMGRLREGHSRALGELFEIHRAKLLRLIRLRIDPHLARRISPEDVLQETFFDASQRVAEYLANESVPFYIWLRFLAVQRMQMLRRTHIEAKARDARREVQISPPGDGLASAASLTGLLTCGLASPSQVAIRKELGDRLHRALEGMDPIDREVLALRHFEELGNAEVAAVLGIGKDAASKRYLRAVVKLREILGDLSGARGK